MKRLKIYIVIFALLMSKSNFGKSAFNALSDMANQAPKFMENAIFALDILDKNQEEIKDKVKTIIDTVNCGKLKISIKGKTISENEIESRKIFVQKLIYTLNNFNKENWKAFHDNYDYGKIFPFALTPLEGGFLDKVSSATPNEVASNIEPKKEQFLSKLKGLIDYYNTLNAKNNKYQELKCESKNIKTALSSAIGLYVIFAPLLFDKEHGILEPTTNLIKALTGQNADILKVIKPIKELAYTVNQFLVLLNQLVSKPS